MCQFEEAYFAKKCQSWFFQVIKGGKVCWLESRCKKITSKTFQSLSEVLENVLQLQNLSLRFNECGQIPDEGFEEIIQSMKSLKDLKHLNLGFNW